MGQVVKEGQITREEAAPYVGESYTFLSDGAAWSRPVGHASKRQGGVRDKEGQRLWDIAPFVRWRSTLVLLMLHPDAFVPAVCVFLGEEM